MNRKGVSVKIDELKTDVGFVKNLQPSIGRLVDETWTEPMGPTPSVKKIMEKAGYTKI